MQGPCCELSLDRNVTQATSSTANVQRLFLSDKRRQGLGSSSACRDQCPVVCINTKYLDRKGKSSKLQNCDSDEDRVRRDQTGNGHSSE